MAVLCIWRGKRMDRVLYQRQSGPVKDSTTLTTVGRGVEKVPQTKFTPVKPGNSCSRLVIQPCDVRQNRIVKLINFHTASWNVRTLQENPNSAEGRATIITKELASYNIDITALSEIRLQKLVILRR